MAENDNEIFTQTTLDEALKAADSSGLLSPTGMKIEPSDESDYELRNRIKMEQAAPQKNFGAAITPAYSKAHTSSVDAQAYSRMGKRWGRR